MEKETGMKGELAELLGKYYTRHIPLRTEFKSEIDALVRDETEKLAGQVRVVPKDYQTMSWAVSLKVALTYPWNIFVYLLLAALLVMFLI